MRHFAAAVVATVATPTVPAHDLPDVVARIAIVSAFAPELALLRDELSGAAVYSLNGVELVTGTLQRREVLLFLSGISVVNAAMTAQLALDHFDVERIVFSGFIRVRCLVQWASMRHVKRTHATTRHRAVL